jgi:soluble epoxide hydrolase/lipid-phosphate phosphatase
MARRRRNDIVLSDLQVDRYGWRHQIRPWVQAGHRVIVPDMLGYGQTDKPLAVADYTLKKLADDLAALLDVAAVLKVVCIVRIHPP